MLISDESGAVSGRLADGRVHPPVRHGAKVLSGAVPIAWADGPFPGTRNVASGRGRGFGARSLLKSFAVSSGATAQRRLKS